MKNLLIISTHSFVDLITNSSSELFICDTDKTIQTIKEILIGLGGKYGIPGDTLFVNIIKEPTICPYNFNLKEYPQFNEYKQFCSYSWDNKSDLEIDTNINWRDWESKNKLESPKNPHKYGTDENRQWYDTVYKKFVRSKKYKDYEKKHREAYQEIHAELSKKRELVEEEMMKWAFQLNNIPYTPVPRPTELYSINDPVWEEWVRKRDANIQFNEAESEFSRAACYGYILKKGNILINSQDDNSIPWELMDEITDVFEAQRIHVG